MYIASTWQAPGSCLASAVCRSWRSAAAGCKGIRLLYFMGRAEEDESFTAWLLHNSPQLGALTLSGYDHSPGATQVLQALVDAAEAASAAGAPLPLHTLRVFRTRYGVDTIDVAGRLLACLPRLRCLQLELKPADATRTPAARLSREVLEHLGPLKQAQQLQELYLSGPLGGDEQVFSAVAGLLPLNLRRLSWCGAICVAAPDLSHLTQLTFLRLDCWSSVTSAGLPPNLQQLELHDFFSEEPPEVLEEQEAVLVGWSSSARDVQQLLGQLTNLRRLALSMEVLGTPAVRTALAQHTQLSALALGGMDGTVEHLSVALAAADGIRNLHSLELNLVVPPLGLSAVKGVTRLVATMCAYGSIHGAPGRSLEQRRGLVEEISRMAGLQWLSVPIVLLQEGWAWLGGLQQLRVLVVHCWGSFDDGTASPEQMLGKFSLGALPPQLYVLCIHDMRAEQAATEQVRRLRQVLGSRGCEGRWG